VALSTTALDACRYEPEPARRCPKVPEGRGEEFLYCVKAAGSAGGSARGGVVGHAASGRSLPTPPRAEPPTCHSEATFRSKLSWRS